MKFEYPIKLNDSSVQRELGSNNQFGFYPIGRLNAWHGGIHLEGVDIEIKAIADGEVIAYRLPTKYSDETILNKTYQYSNGFILIKHYYNSPKGQELTFYSLYLHLMSKDEIKTKNKKIPDIFAKKVNKVTANDHIVGLNAINMLDENDIPFVIPYGATVQFDDIPAWLEFVHWSKDEKHKDKAYRRIKYTDSNGKTELNILISTAGGRIAADIMTDITNEVKINTKEDKGSQVGALVRRTTDTNSEILRIIPKGAEIEIESEEGDKWAKVIDKDGKKPTGPEGFVLLSNVERSEIFDDKKNVYDKVQPCNIPVKAGEMIGYTGAYGFEQNPNYRAAHIEVFTGDEVSDFLADSKNDGEKEKKYFKLLQGAVLKKAMPYKLVQETSVKIISEHGNFTQVEVGPLIREAYKIVGGVEHLKYQPLGKYYDIVGDHFETVNCNFNNSLNKSDKLYLVKELAGDLRRLRYDYPIKGEKYWVPSSAIQRDTPPPPPAAPLPAIDAIAPAGYSRQANTTVDSTAENATTPTLAASETAIESAPTQSPTTNQAKLIVDVEELYLEYPDDCEEDDKIPEDIIVKTSDFKKVKHNDGTYSYLILCECFEKGIGVTKKGWISDTNSKLKKISAYNWEEFGFKVIKDNQDELIYTPDAPPQFLKDVWKQIDADGNNVLTEQELRYAMKNKSISKKLSHLICLHTSEWSYKESKLSSLKNKLNTLFDEGIKQEEDAACKQELKDKRKAVLDAMEARVKNLSWWKEVKDNALFGNNPFSPGAAKKEKKEAAKPVEIPFAPEEELKGPTLFPDSKPKVYHFHPLAFVRQMRRMARSNEIHIYHTGHISKTDLTKAETVIYIYHDKDGGIHELGEFPIVWTQKWAKGSYTKGTEGKWKTITNDGKTRHYQYDGDNKSPLMTPYSLSDGRKVYNYRKNDIKIAINEATDREYYNPEAFATVLGALADGDFTDIVSNGSVDVDGTGAFSVSHINGINMDFKYLRTDKKKGYIDNNIKRILVNDILLDIPRQNQLLNSLYKFGWGVLTKNLSNKTRENKELNHCKSEDHHKDHLHIQGFSPKYK